jgi:membrane-associated protein
MFDVNSLVQSGGILVISIIVFSETGLLLGLLLPGDSLLLAAGLFAAQGHLPIEWLVPAVVAAAIIGYFVGYWIGRRAGPRVFRRQDGLFFRHEYVDKTENFFKKHGGKTIILARFIPYLRTFVPVVAGVGRMDQRLFSAYNIIGGVVWAGGVTLASYWLGNSVPNIDRFIFLVVVVSLVIFHTGLFWHLLHSPSRRQQFKTGLREEWNYLFGKTKK